MATASSTRTAPAARGGGAGRGGGGGRGGGASDLRGAQPGRDNDPSSGVRPAMTVAPQDQVYFKAVSDAYKRITGIETVPMPGTPRAPSSSTGTFSSACLRSAPRGGV